MGVITKTASNESTESRGKIWSGPEVIDIKEMARWPSVGHYVLHKLDHEFRDTLLFTDFKSGRSWTGGQMKDKILNIACALVDKYQFKPKTIVCISYENSDHLLLLSLAIICAGGTISCAFHLDPYAELLYLARKVEPRFLFCHERNRDQWARQLSSDLGLEVRGVSLEGDEFEALLSYDHSCSASRSRIPYTCQDLKRHLAIISMSSGTSGKPKAVATTHWNTLADLLMNPRKSAPGVAFPCCASLDYVSGRIIMFGAIHMGYHAILLDGFEPATYLEAVQRYRVSIIYVGAAAFYNLITYEHLARFDLSSLRCVFPMGAKIIYLDELRKFFRANPQIVQVRQGYGTSEFSGGSINSFTPDEYLRDCQNCGQLLPGMRAKIVDPMSGALLGPNERGILYIRGETLFPGYYDASLARNKRAECATNGLDNDEDDSLVPFVRDSQIFDEDGFYITGDMAYFTDTEELYIIGRLNEMMSCRGAKKVLPAELEIIIGEHPAVLKVCVLGIPNKRELTLHCPRAFVVPKSNYYTDKLDELKLSTRLSTLNTDLNQDLADEKLVYSGVGADGDNKQEDDCDLKYCRMSKQRRRLILEDLMKFVNERVGWEKQLTGGLVLLDDIPTSRGTGKFDKNFLRSLKLSDIEIYGDRSG